MFQSIAVILNESFIATHKNILLKRFPVHPFVLLQNFLQVHFRATHYDPIQRATVGTEALRMEQISSELQ